MNNSTTQRQHDGCILMITVTDHTNDIIMTIIYSLISVFTVTSNATLIVVLPKVKKQLTRFDRMFILLSSCDIMVGLIQMPYQIYLIHQIGVVTCIQVGIKTMLSISLSMTSGLITFVIINDRFLLITRNQFHGRFLNSKSTVFIVIIMVMIALGWAAIGVYVSILGEQFAKVIFFLTYGCFCGMLLIEAIVINILLFRNLRELSKSSSIHSSTNKIGYKRSVNKTIIIICIVLIGAYSPIVFSFIFGSTLRLIKTVNQPSNTRFLTWVILPTNLNAGLNSSIFMWRKKAFRCYLKSLFTRKEYSATSYKIWRLFDKIWRIFDKIWRLFDKIWRLFNKIWRIFDKIWRLFDKIWRLFDICSLI